MTERIQPDPSKEWPELWLEEGDTLLSLLGQAVPVEAEPKPSEGESQTATTAQTQTTHQPESTQSS